ncbi:Protein C21orf2 homolog, putative [Trypanosoma equiperdum]|uniref:U2A'/phosphoprotein 32 family A C-terminal domain-containing protein n=3 Tax=Trypanozoon TaxID=39700 RepID=Q38B89_TRYB2|nr:hypothetical protein, conserved [Trypanosoma brucei gambiense DAL972]XP_822759.1 hypothetical protein, conserved [Trypanosoma brucei brucei TREU927]EAN77931.1 hypothetical protein, conserved [Trypanosoma brucei brucei TREU927]CBH15535.1 hypothetical protein, conserved [Trypanosoma brucei gambiense DAL972]SCU68614.1 Protein C21orf2 homolog, putative [Trypanosoma equiperdum]|eukprot:XP_011777799.1 hypothetical protein, conserved [Trypanosoma brucei gambiense DAL972]
MILKEETVLRKTNAENLAAVRNLNLWGEGLTDVSIVSRLPRIEVLALAANKLTTLSPFAACTQLEELYLRRNNVASMLEIKYLRHLPKLHTLWLMDNPCARHPHYRQIVILCCRHLRHLDETEVSEKERAEAEKLLPEGMLQEMLESESAEAAVGTANKAQLQNRTPVSERKQPMGEVVQGGAIHETGAGRERGHRVTSSDTSGRGPSSAPERRQGSADDGLAQTAVQVQRAMFSSIMALVPELAVQTIEALQKELAEELCRRGKRLPPVVRDRT